MRGHHHVGEREQRRLGGRLGGEHVDRGTGDGALGERGGQRRLVDDPAARGVDDPQSGLRLRQHLGVEEPERLGRLRQVDREEVDAAHETREVRLELDSELASPLGAHVRVVRDEAHAEREAALRDEHADASEADDAERLAVQLDARPARAVPLARLEVGVGLRDVARHRQQQRHRLLRRRDHVRLRRVDDHDAALGGGGDVDVVEADAGTTDDDEIGRRGEHVGRHLGGAADHDRRRARDRGQELLRRQAEPDVDVEPGGPHVVEPAFGELLGHEHARQVDSPLVGRQLRKSTMRPTPSPRSSSPRANDMRA